MLREMPLDKGGKSWYEYTGLPAARRLQEVTVYETTFPASDRAVLRRLAAQVAGLAARPEEAAKRELWYQHNDLQPTRPVIFCDPENSWNEIIPGSALECRVEQARFWEMALRREIFWGTQMRDDRVIEPYFDVPHVFTESGWGLEAQTIGGEDGGAYTWDPPLKSYDDLPRLTVPQITINWTLTDRLHMLAQELFGDLLTVRQRTPAGLPPSVWWTVSPAPLGVWWWSFGMTLPLVHLRGLAQVMYDMIDRPADLHRLMAFLRDAHIERLNYLESHDLLSLNNDGTYVGSGGFGWTRQLPQPDFNGHVRPCDMWGFGESQETVGVSPAMFAEFVLPYQLPLLERFGLNCYGCCEPLDKRWHVVCQIPRLRRVSVSAWASVPKMAELLGDRYIFSWKPNPADLALPSFDEDRIRAALRAMMAQTRNCRVEVIMKDNHTIRNDPSRVVRWVRIALEEAEAV